MMYVLIGVVQMSKNSFQISWLEYLLSHLEYVESVLDLDDFSQVYLRDIVSTIRDCVERLREMDD